jgi:hypothetical protein
MLGTLLYSKMQFLKMVTSAARGVRTPEPPPSGSAPDSLLCFNFIEILFLLVDAASGHCSYPPVYIEIITFVFIKMTMCTDEGTDNQHIQENILANAYSLWAPGQHQKGSFSPRELCV